MTETPKASICPNCRSAEEPIPLVPGAGLRGGQWVVRCRRCACDFTDDEQSLRLVS